MGGTGSRAIVTFALALCVAAVVGWSAVVGSVAHEDLSEPTYYDKLESYGNLTYGEGGYEIYNAMSVVGGGLHIDTGSRVVHPHDLKPGVLDRAYEYEHRGVGEWPPEERYLPWWERAWVETAKLFVGSFALVALVSLFSWVYLNWW